MLTSASSITVHEQDLSSSFWSVYDISLDCINDCVNVTLAVVEQKIYIY